MKKIYTLLFALFFIGSLARASTNHLEYYDGDLNSAIQKAEQENKIVFVKFYADWCMPCQWMDETTLSDNQIVNKIQSNSIPLKVNVDEFDGFELRQKLDVKVLPTILIYDPSGKMIKRIEEPLPQSKMNKMLDEVIRNPASTTIHQSNKSPRSTIKENNSLKKDYENRPYKLSLGEFYSFPEVMDFLESISSKINHQALVLNEYKNGKTVFKVLIGRYDSHAVAEEAKRKLLAESGIRSTIY